ncbi:MAG TPA: hypothetical protein PK916_17180 [Bacteroidota bacterium]|nr:hypothetical protein [Bacteroidota bacterium]
MRNSWLFGSGLLLGAMFLGSCDGEKSDRPDAEPAMTVDSLARQDEGEGVMTPGGSIDGYDDVDSARIPRGSREIIHTAPDQGRIDSIKKR